MKTTKRTYTFQVYPREVDLNKEMTIVALGGCILDAAGLAAREQGFGMEYMHEHGIAWVVSRLSIECYSFPKEYTTFTIETWIEQVSSLVSTRHFKLYDVDQVLIGKATSLWSLIDLQTRRPINLLERTEMVPYIDGSPLDIEPPKRIKSLSGQGLLVHRIAYSDIDINRHVNSMKYVQWILDMLPNEHFMQTRLKRLDVNYSKEALWGEEVYYNSETSHNKSIYELHTSENETLCRLLFEWCER